MYVMLINTSQYLHINIENNVTLESSCLHCSSLEFTKINKQVKVFTRSAKNPFWTLGLPDGVHSNRPCLSISLYVHLPTRQSIFKYLRDSTLFFSNFLHEGREPYGHKSDKARFLKIKSLGVTNRGKPQFLGIFYVFCPYLCIQSLKFSEISYS